MPASRDTLIDALKVVASQLIVLHHLATYGVLSDVWDAAATASSDWFFEYGRMAVQVFLVMGGFLAAKGFSRSGPTSASQWWYSLLRRHLRLALPLTVALVIAVLSSLVARQWAHFLFFPEFPSWSQFVAHVLLAQTITGQSSLSAGVWYIAMDFQMYLLTATFLWLNPIWGRWLVGSLMLASLFYFNLNPDLDNWALYFFGAYGMGCMAYWVSKSRHPWVGLGALLLVGIAALLLDFRERIAIALFTAMLLGYMQFARKPTPLRSHDKEGRLLLALSNSSYALFLTHFSVVMLGNALYFKLGLQSAFSGALMILGCWVLSNVLALAFEHWIERALYRWQGRLFARWTPASLPLA